MWALMPSQRRSASFVTVRTPAWRAALTAVSVTEVAADGPAGRAGLRPGDLLLAVDEAELVGVDGLHRLLTAERIGRSVTLRLLRGREIVTVAVVPAARA